MTANKPMTGEQLDELMTAAVNMQRDAETDCNRPSAMFAYAVQVAVLELRKVRNDAAALAAENAGLKAAIVEHSQCFTVCKCCGTENDCSHDDVCRAVNETPETDSFLAEVRAIAIETCADDFVSKNNIGGYEIDAIYVYAENLRKGVQS
ncbi:hypothetical protein ACJYFV_16290 [Enterobacter asburiae]|uniref:hypothetical protein n=1 Tax=Enterobacter asburiae TaxID=61645 RepID=UPI0018E9A9BB|nr:hypothetical protein [Enterobacter asburiae]MBJ3795528.1 hypothetical protein [Enterobacter asburiae]